MIQHREIPPTLLFDFPNSKISFEKSPVYIADKLIKCEPDKTMRVGVSGFGFSGTNCHVVLEEYPRKITDSDNQPDIFTLSAPVQKQLYEWVGEFAKHDISAYSLGDICYTQNVRREHHGCRLVILVNNTADLIRNLKHIAKNNNMDCTRGYAWLSGEYESTGFKTVKGIVAERNPELTPLLGVAERYLGGESVDWTAEYANRKCRTVSLPACPLQKVSCWFTQDMSSVKSEGIVEQTHWLIDELVEQTETVEIYRTSLSSDSNPIIQDHMVLGENVLPGTAYIEMIHYIMKNKQESSLITVSDLEFFRPIYAKTDMATEIEIELQKTDDQRYCVTFYTIDDIGSRFENKNATAQIELCPKSEIPIENICVPKDAEYYPIDQQKLTKGFISFGPRWNTLSISLHEVNEQEIWARIQSSPDFAADFDMLYLHPSMLDMAVNATTLTLGRPYLPYKYKKIYIYKPLGREAYTRFIVHGDKLGEIITYDLMLFNGSDELCVKIDGYMVKYVSNFNIFSKRQDRLFNKPVWVEKPFLNEGILSDNASVLIIKTDRSAVSTVEKGLINKGVELSVTDIDEFTRDPQSVWASQNIIIFDIDTGVVEYTDQPRFELAADTYLIGLFRLLKVLNERLNYRCRVVAMGHGVYKAVDGDIANPISAACFALLESYFCENPYISSLSLDLDDNTGFERFSDLLFMSDERKCLFRSNRQYIQEIEAVDIDNRGKVLSDTLEGKNIVITGGFGGIGLELAKYFSSKKAKSISVFARRSKEKTIAGDFEKAAAIENAITQVEENGTAFYSYSVDVSDIDSVRNAAQEIHRAVGAVSGIVHCAGIAGAGMLANKSESEFIRVISPKIFGTNALTNVFGKEAEFMLLMSSVASIAGIAGQTDYAAANAFMDNFAQMAHYGNCKITAINWPSWSRVGMAKDNNFVVDTFVKVIEPSFAAELLDKAFCVLPEQIILGEWNPDILDSIYAPSLDGTAIKRFLTLLKKENIGYTAMPDKSPVNVKLLGKADDEYTETEKTFAGIWAKVLAADEIDVNANFYDMGGNSILASYLIKELEKKYPELFDITDIFTYSTVSKISEYYDSKVNGDKYFDIEPQSKDDLAQKDLEDILAKLAAGEIDVDEVNKIF
jgi:acyl transferase domain-containing protein